MEQKINWKYEIGQVLKDYNRDLVIINRKVVQYKNTNTKYYKYKCNKCGFDCGEHYKNQEYKEEYWIKEGYLCYTKSGCNCCGGKEVIVVGINDIPTTSPEIVKYFQGGYDEAKKYSKGCGKKIFPICPDCKRIRKNRMEIYSMVKNKGFKCQCKNGTSYGEQFIFNMLEQLKIQFIPQLNKSTFEWCGNKKYDFYIPSINKIIEVHGLQHYQNAGGIFKKTLEEEQENDKYKKELALRNGFCDTDYIIIDCRYSKLEWIKNNILKSELLKYFNMFKIDWLKCEEFALSNRIKEVCDLWNTKKYSTKEIAKIMKIAQHTVVMYLNQGSDIWCKYNGKEELKKSAIKNGKLKYKSVICIENEQVFESASDCAKKSKAIFGIEFNNSKICKVCRGEATHHKGFHFKYISDLTDDEKRRYNINNIADENNASINM